MTINDFGPSSATLIKTVWYAAGLVFCVVDYRVHRKLAFTTILFFFMGPICWTMLGAARLYQKLFPAHTSERAEHRLWFEVFVVLVGMVPWVIAGMWFITLHK